MKKLTIYAIPVSLYCAKLRILLRHKQLDWQELPPPGGYGSDEYAELVPAGSLPALRDGDFLLSDSEAIAEYLNEKYPQYPLLPGCAETRAKARELSRFHDTRLEPELRKLFAHIAPDKRDGHIVSKQASMLSARLKELSQLLEGSAAVSKQAHASASFQNELTLGDCGLAISFVWIEQLSQAMGFNVEWPETVLQYKAHLQRFSAIDSELSEYQPTLEAWLSTAIEPRTVS